MTAAERIYELVKAMPDDQVYQILAFVEALDVNNNLRTQPKSQTIPEGTLTGLRGIAKQRTIAPTDEEVREEYTDYLVKKYQ